MRRTSVSPSITPARLTKWVFLAFVAWIGWHILAPYPQYLPPNFDVGFLRGKGEFFYRNGYSIGFFAHILAAPLALLPGAMQASRTLRVRRPYFHRVLGRLYCVLVLLLVTPGGLLMAMKAYGGWSGVCCFSLIAIFTWFSTFMGWRTARSSQYASHARWMLRSYTLMLSAIFLRLTNISLTELEFGHEFTYQFSAWISWLVPLAIVESVLALQKTTKPKKGLVVEG
ncbi:MAG: DUF2306 domain-containing protein [Planctomycetota bacterium]